MACAHAPCPRALPTARRGTKRGGWEAREGVRSESEGALLKNINIDKKKWERKKVRGARGMAFVLAF